MARSKNLEGIVCLNHPSTPATARCATCGKPICDACAKTEDGLICCSDLCLANALASQTKAEQFVASRSKGESLRRTAGLVRLAIIIVLVVLGFVFRKPIMQFVRRITGRANSSIGQQIQQIQQRGEQWDRNVRKKSTEDRMTIQ